MTRRKRQMTKGGRGKGQSSKNDISFNPFPHTDRSSKNDNFLNPCPHTDKSSKNDNFLNPFPHTDTFVASATDDLENLLSDGEIDHK